MVWNQCCSWAVHAGLPIVAAYHVLCSSPFFNVAAEDAQGMEQCANLCLAPVQYLLAGKTAIPQRSKETGQVIGYRLEQRFHYEDPGLWYKTALCYFALPSSLFTGSLLKGASYLFHEVRERSEKIYASLLQEPIDHHKSLYASYGMQMVSWEEADLLEPLGYERRPGDEKCLQAEKVALQEILSLFDRYGVVYWLDCGSCLGAYRYGGNIPWDWDIDLAILQPDFDLALQALQGLDPSRYVVQDWSGRDRPKTYLKVYVKETHSLIDIYHFAIDEKKQEIHSILSNEHSVFLPHSWKERERKYTVATPFALVFPLKKAYFDGIGVFVPGKTKEYLQQRYGDNIDPVKTYNAQTGQYEKDLSHPYWKDSYAR